MLPNHHPNIRFQNIRTGRADKAEREAVDRLLAADALAADALAADALTWLCDRTRYAAVARALRAACPFMHGYNDLFKILLNPNNRALRVWRLAVGFGVVGYNQPFSLTTEDLRKMALKGHQGAALTLAAYGTPAAPWPDLSRPERAAYALGELVRLHRERGS